MSTEEYTLYRQYKSLILSARTCNTSRTKDLGRVFLYIWLCSSAPSEKPLLVSSPYLQNFFILWSFKFFLWCICSYCPSQLSEDLIPLQTKDKNFLFASPIKLWRLLESNTNSQCSTGSFLIARALPSCRTYFCKGVIFNLNVIVYHNSDQRNASHTFVQRSRNANSSDSKCLLFYFHFSLLSLR